MHLWQEYCEKHMVLTGGVAQLADVLQLLVLGQNGRSNPFENCPVTLETGDGRLEIRFNQAETADITQVARP